MMAEPRTLYICYFGIREPLVQTQVLAYLREIQKGGTRVSILTFEPAPGDWVESVRSDLASEGIDWHWLKYHKRPSVPATLFDIANGFRAVAALARKGQIDVFHARGHLPAPIAALAKKVYGGKFLFDIRGFLPEEYVDAGVWDSNGLIYRSFKRLERWLMKESDAFVVLTEKACSLLFPDGIAGGEDGSGRPIEVIPCCVDLSHFEGARKAIREQARSELGIDDRFTVAYVGSFDGWYLSEEMFDFFETVKRTLPRTFAMILTQRDQQRIRDELLRRGFNDDEFVVKGVAPSEVGRHLFAADASLSFIKASYSKQSSSPTKIAEYLAAGLPVISNRGVGDLDDLIERNGVGVMVDEFSPAEYAKAIRGVADLGDPSEKCRNLARAEFDLGGVGGVRYRRIYASLLHGTNR